MVSVVAVVWARGSVKAVRLTSAKAQGYNRFVLPV